MRILLNKEDSPIEINNFQQFLQVISTDKDILIHDNEVRDMAMNYRLYDSLKNICTCTDIIKTLDRYGVDVLPMTDDIVESFNQNTLHNFFDHKKIMYLNLDGKCINEFKRSEAIIMDSAGHLKAFSFPMINLFEDLIKYQKHKGRRRCQICMEKEFRTTLHCFNCKEHKICIHCFLKFDSTKCPFCTLNLYDLVMHNVAKFGVKGLIRFYTVGELKID
jgi:hypothetical protein